MRVCLSTMIVALAGAFAAPLAAQDLTEVLLHQVKSDPAPFLALAGDLIRSQGSAQGIDQTGVNRFVALERAVALASARRLQRADHDLDGLVTGDEMAALVASVAAASADRLWSQHGVADGNGDGSLTAVEVAAFGRAEALKSFSSQDEALARSVLAFDRDGDGFVSLAEVEAAVSALGT